MVEHRPALTFFSHVVLVLGVLTVAFPLWVTFVASTQTLEEVLRVPMSLWPGGHGWDNYRQVLTGGSTRGAAAPVGRMLFNSLVMALAIAFGKIAISLLASFAIVYFRLPGRRLAFWLIFVTLMLPVEVRIIPTFKVVADLGLLDSYVGLTLPDELAEAARVDGAGPMRFFFVGLRPDAGARHWFDADSGRRLSVAQVMGTGTPTPT